MKEYIKYFALSVLFLLGTVSCAQEEGSESTVPEQQSQDKTMKVTGVNDKEWTYISLTTGKVVGKSVFGSADEDDAWKARSDWDMALCGKYIRTNGGTSGNGEGGLLKVEDKNYESITQPTRDAFDMDKWIEQ